MSSSRRRHGHGREGERRQRRSGHGRETSQETRYEEVVAATAAEETPRSLLSGFRPSGGKRALLIGINYSGAAKLKGCVRDVTFMHHLLRTRFGFRDKQMYVLTDKSTGLKGVHTARPTKKNILSAMKWLVSDARPGDLLFFSFSGHGSQRVDTSGDEADGYDETILPMDYKTAGHIVDDRIYDIMVRGIPAGARLTAVMDCCHSGTGMDLPYEHHVYSDGGMSSGLGEGGKLGTLINIAGSLMSGNNAAALQHGMRLMGLYGRRKQRGQHTPDPNAGEVILFSGCRDNQVASDTNSLAGVTTGAMTYCFVHAIEHSPHADWRNYTYKQLLINMREILRTAGFKQIPQFSTSHPFDLNSAFIL